MTDINQQLWDRGFGVLRTEKHQKKRERKLYFKEVEKVQEEEKQIEGESNQRKVAFYKKLFEKQEEGQKLSRRQRKVLEWIEKEGGDVEAKRKEFLGINDEWKKEKAGFNKSLERIKKSKEEKERQRE